MPDAKGGDVWLVDLGLAARVRPALVINVPFRERERAPLRDHPPTRQQRGAPVSKCTWPCRDFNPVHSTCKVCAVFPPTFLSANCQL